MVQQVQRRKDQLLLVLLSLHYLFVLSFGVATGHFEHAAGPGSLAMIAAASAFFWKPGTLFSRGVIAVSLIIFSGILIHLSNGRIEMHFHVFMSLALLSIYYDWRVIIIAAVTVFTHHLLGLLFPFFQVYGSQGVGEIFLLHVLFVSLTSAILCYQSYVINHSISTINHSSRVLSEHDLVQLLHYVQQVASGDMTATLELKAEMVPVVANDELGYASRLFNQLIMGLRSIGTATSQMGQDFSEILRSSQENVNHINNLCERILNSAGNEDLQNLPSVNIEEYYHHLDTGLRKQIEVTSAKMVLASLRLDMLQHQLETKMNEQNSLNHQLAEMSRARERFFASLSHELRTPLTSILGFGELLVTEMQGPLSPVQLNSSKQIFQSALNMQQLINDILDFSKMQAGKLTVYPEKTVVAEYISRAIGEVEILAETKNLSVTTQIDHKLTALTDPHRLHQILLNLLSNAIKFTNPGGSIQVRAFELRYEGGDAWWQSGKTPWSFARAFPVIKLSPGCWVCIQVIDSGIGIASEKLPVIFEEFGQIEDGVIRNTGGTGLGLAIVTNLMELLNGQVVVESVSGEGTTFSVLLPLYRSTLLALPAGLETLGCNAN